MSPDLLQVKEEAREADAAWQAAAALSDIAEALAEGHGEHDEGRDEGVETSEGAAASVLSEHDGHATAMDTSAEPSSSHDTPASAVDAMDATDEPKESDSDAAMAKANATKATEVSDDVAVRAAEALGRIGLIKLPERRPKAPKAGDPEADAIEAMEAAILAAETPAAPAAPAAPAPAEAPPKTKTAVKAAPAAAKSRAQSKASVKDLRAKLDQCRDDKTAASTASTASTASPATSAISGATSSATSAAKAASAVGPAAIAAAPAPGAGGKMPLGTASELRARLLEAKQRLGVGVANGQSPITALPPPPEKKDKKEKKEKKEGKEKKDEEDKDKKKKKDKKEKKREKEARQTPIPKQQALPLLCEEKDAKDSKEEAEKKVAIEQAKARRLEELREREAQKVQQVHSKAAARKKKEVEDSVRELARKLSQDILEISEIINVENIKEEAVKREGRVGHFGVPGAMANVKSEVKQETGAAGLALAQLASPSIADFVKSENVKSEMAQGMKSETGLPGLPPGLGPEQRQMIISPELYAQQMSQLKSMATPEAMALSASSSAATPHFDARLEAEDLTKPTVCTIGWEPNVEPHVMIKLLEGYRIGAIIDARPPEFNTDGFGHACAAHGWTYDRQPVLSIHPYDLGPMGPVAFNTIGRIVSQARAAAAAGNDGSCRRQCILFAGDQSWQDECNWHIVKNRLRGCAIEVQQISLDRYWDEAAVFEEEETEKGGVIVAGPPLTQVVDELRNQVGLPKIGDERDRQLMVTARAGLETWVAKKFKQDARLSSKVLGPEATLKEKIDSLREACPELSRVVSMAHFLRMIGNNSAHTGGAAIPPRYQLVQLVQKLTHEIKEADAVSKAHDEADKKWETAEPFAAVLAKISGEPQQNPRAPVSARLQLQQSIIVPQDGEHKATLVYLHPFGSGNLRYLQGKSAFSAKGVRIVLPLAPTMPITAYNKRQCISWFDYYGSDRDLEADPLSLEDVRVRLSLTLEREATLLGENGHKRLLIGGLAQGGEAALHAALMHHKVLGGFVGVCTNLLPCTLPEGGGRMKLHFFGYDRDPRKWASQTRDPLLAHHDLVEHGDVFGEAGAFNLAKIDFKLEAQCLHLASEVLLEPEAETEDAAAVDATDADADEAPEGEAPDAEMQDEAENEENEPEEIDGLHLDCEAACEALLEAEAEEERKNAAAVDDANAADETAPTDATDANAADEAAPADAADAADEAAPADAVDAADEAAPADATDAADEAAPADAANAADEAAPADATDAADEAAPADATDANAADEAPEGEAPDDAKMQDEGEVNETEEADGEGGLKRNSDSLTLMRATAKVMPAKRARTSYEQDADGQD